MNRGLQNPCTHSRLIHRTGGQAATSDFVDGAGDPAGHVVMAISGRESMSLWEATEEEPGGKGGGRGGLQSDSEER